MPLDKGLSHVSHGSPFPVTNVRCKYRVTVAFASTQDNSCLFAHRRYGLQFSITSEWCALDYSMICTTQT
eukprot:SAG31_NODE_397_length_16251_cov_7.922486_6_plen_70_part_00